MEKYVLEHSKSLWLKVIMPTLLMIGILIFQIIKRKNHPSMEKSTGKILPIIILVFLFISLTGGVWAQYEKVNPADEPAIHRAVLEGNVQKVKELIKEKPELINLKDKSGMYPIHYAAREGKLPILKILIKAGADLEQKGPYNHTPLMVAAGMGKSKVVSYLLDKGAAIDYIAYPGGTALREATVGGDLKTIKLLIDRGADMYIEDNSGYRPFYQGLVNFEVTKLYLDKGFDIKRKPKKSMGPILWKASFGKNPKVIKLLIDKGASVNEKSEFGYYALHQCASSNDAASAKVLIDAGADVNIKDSEGETPVFKTFNNKTPETFNLFLKSGADVKVINVNGNTLLHKFAQFGNSSELSQLIKAGIDLDHQNNRGETALHIASEFGNLEALKILTKSGADLTIKDNNGQQAYDLTCFAQCNNHLETIRFMLKKDKSQKPIRDKYFQPPNLFHLEKCKDAHAIVKFFINRGYRINDPENAEKFVSRAAQCGDAETFKLIAESGVSINQKKYPDLLNTAVHFGNPSTVKYLLQEGYDPNHRDKDRNTALFYSFGSLYEENTAKIVKILISKNAEVNVKNKKGETPLHRAVSHPYNFEPVEILLKAGADVNTADGRGNTPLHIMVLNVDDWSVKRFLKFKPNLNIKNKEGKTPLDIAREEGFKEIVKLLTKTD